MTETLENITTETLQELTAQQAWHYGIIPYLIDENNFKAYLADPKDIETTELELGLLFGKTIHLTPVSNELIEEYLGKYYRRTDQRQQSQQVNWQKGEGDFLDTLIQEARSLGSSDIHLEPYEENSRVRFRIDGQLIERYRLEKPQYPGLVNKIKIKSNLDIAEKRLPQDGRIFFQADGGKFDIRVSILPTLHGEKIVMRLLSGNAVDIDIRQLGFGEEEMALFLEGVRRPNGMVLISGPTGSGKTTTLYATLQILNETTRNVVTIEDPIEYTLEGINQVQLKTAIGLDFASAMRTFLRQDPDVIMVGEIRDVNTARMAIRASLTGHLVMSTIHTNSAWGIVARIIDMGVPSYLLADTLNIAASQRLLRLLCPHCKTKQQLVREDYPRNFQPSVALATQWVAKGCQQCHYTGYQGRKAVYEIIPITKELAHHIKQQNLNIPDLLKAQGIKSLADNAFQLFADGKTTLEEVYPILATKSW